jgi:hypothetical protein
MGLELSERIGKIPMCQRRLQRSKTPKAELTARPGDELKRPAEHIETELFGQRASE